MSHRIFVGPELLGCSLVHDRNISALQVITLCKYASGDERRLQYSKIAWTHDDQRQVRRAARIDCLTLNSHFGNELICRERERPGNPSLLHAGNAVEPVQQLAIEGVAPIKIAIRIALRMVRHRQPHARGFHVCGIESCINVYKPPERSREQPGSCQQHERHSNLGDD